MRAFRKTISTLIFASVLLSGAMLTGCATKSKTDPDKLAQKQVEELYEKGKAALDKGNYSFALRYFQALEANYPFGTYTEQAKLDMIYAFDKTSQPERAVEAANNFIKLYPTHKNVDYAYYMKGVATFDKKQSSFDKFVKGGAKFIRDPQPLRESEQAFNELIRRYPQSKYSEDAKQRLVYIRNTLASRELQVAQYYYEHETYVAAINRCKNIVYGFETSPSVEPALVLMEKTYEKMGLTDLAKSTQEVLMKNFPETGKKIAKQKKKGYLKRLFSRKKKDTK